MRYIKTKIVSFFLLFFLSCTSGIKNDKIRALSLVEGFSINSHTEAIVLISDKTCPTCNEKFINIVNKKLNDNNYIFVISSSGNNNVIDLEPYISSKRGNVIIDRKKTLYYNDNIDASFIAFLSNGDFDTLIEIKPSELNSQIDYINNRLQTK